MPMSDDGEIDEEILEEGCYFLSRMGLTFAQLAAHFEIPLDRAAALAKSYESKLNSGKVSAGDVDRAFWEEVMKEAEGDVKLTFLSEKGFHHAWKSELRRLDGSALMSIYESTKDYLGADPNQRFLDFPPPKGYDPLALDRELKKAVGVLEELLAEKWASEKSQGKQDAAKT
jgi:hypothetical protein